MNRHEIFPGTQDSKEEIKQLDEAVGNSASLLRRGSEQVGSAETTPWSPEQVAQALEGIKGFLERKRELLEQDEMPTELAEVIEKLGAVDAIYQEVLTAEDIDAAMLERINEVIG